MARHSHHWGSSRQKQLESLPQSLPSPAICSSHGLRLFSFLAKGTGFKGVSGGDTSQRGFPPAALPQQCRGRERSPAGVRLRGGGRRGQRSLGAAAVFTASLMLAAGATVRPDIIHSLTRAPAHSISKQWLTPALLLFTGRARKTGRTSAEPPPAAKGAGWRRGPARSPPAAPTRASARARPVPLLPALRSRPNRAGNGTSSGGTAGLGRGGDAGALPRLTPTRSLCPDLICRAHGLLLLLKPHTPLPGGGGSAPPVPRGKGQVRSQSERHLLRRPWNTWRDKRCPPREAARPQPPPPQPGRTRAGKGFPVLPEDSIPELRSQMKDDCRRNPLLPQCFTPIFGLGFTVWWGFWGGVEG